LIFSDFESTFGGVDNVVCEPDLDVLSEQFSSQNTSTENRLETIVTSPNKISYGLKKSTDEQSEVDIFGRDGNRIKTEVQEHRKRSSNSNHSFPTPPKQFSKRLLDERNLLSSKPFDPQTLLVQERFTSNGRRCKRILQTVGHSTQNDVDRIIHTDESTQMIVDKLHASVQTDYISGTQSIGTLLFNNYFNSSLFFGYLV
jgi:hypothetical protein